MNADDGKKVVKSWSVNFIAYADDDKDAVVARVLAALDVEELDFDPMTVEVEAV